MAKKLYLDGKYIVADFDDGSFIYFPAKDCVFEKTSAGVSIQSRVTDDSLGITDAEAPTWDNSAGGGTPYSAATLLTFVKENTANFREAATSLDDIADVPAYSGNGGKVLAVKSTEDGAEWIDRDGKDVKVYRALISQTGVAAPTAVVLENTLGVTPTFSYTNVGEYVLDTAGSGIFVDGKSTVLMASGAFVPASIVKPMITADFFADASRCYISVVDMDAANAGVDGKLSSSYIEIKVYP